MRCGDKALGAMLGRASRTLSLFSHCGVEIRVNQSLALHAQLVPETNTCGRYYIYIYLIFIFSSLAR